MTKILLVGNPNTGKTTLFNTITKAKEHAGNWHGVTVAVKERAFEYKKQEFVLCDLPGLYSLDGLTYEEQVASEFIDNNQEAVIICLLDANNLRRNLYLAFELMDRSKNVILAVNMAKEVSSFSDTRLCKALKVPVIGIDARKTKSVAGLLDKVVEMAHNLPKSSETVLKGATINKNTCKNATLNEPWQKDSKSLGATKLNLDKIKERNEHKEFSLESFENKSIARFKQIDEVLSKAGYKQTGVYGASKIDKILLNGFLSPIIFFAIMGLVFFITFGSFGTFISELISNLFEFCFNGVLSWLSTFITSEPLLDFLENGVIGGAITVITFMPQIILMFICLNFLEDIGYLSRVAFMFDGLFKKLGLTGRSAFSLIMGFGCTTSAVITTRNLESKRAREQTTLMLPFMSCSAKLPIYSVICSAFFSEHKALMVFGLYVLGIIIMILISLIMKAFTKAETKETFILEMPKYRMPQLKKVISGALETAKSFLIRVGGVLVISSMVIFLLNNFAFDFSYVSTSGEASILQTLATNLKGLFAPLGFGMAGAVVALISGIIAKEMVVSSLAIINGVSAGALAESLLAVSSPVHFNSISAISFLVFILLYSPCISAVLSMKKEYGTKLALKSFILQFIVAYVVSFLVYNLGLLFTQIWWLATLVLILLATSFVLVLKLGKKGQKFLHCFNNCHQCKNTCSKED